MFIITLTLKIRCLIVSKQLHADVKSYGQVQYSQKLTIPIFSFSGVEHQSGIINATATSVRCIWPGSALRSSIILKDPSQMYDPSIPPKSSPRWTLLR